MYSWSLSPSGRTLTITPGSDDCAARLSAVPGVWWLAGCPNELCLAELDAGTYQSQYIVPRLDPGAAWEPDFGGLTYTVPEGWANSNDAPESFELVPASELPPVGGERPAPEHRGLHAADGHDPGSAVLRPDRARRGPHGR